MIIFVRRMKVYASHGVLPQEQIVGTNFYVSVEVDVPDTQASLTDELTDTVSYADLATIIKEEMKETSKLVEHVAGRIGRRIMTTFHSIQSAKVRIEKENPPMGAECEGAGVELTFYR